MKVIKFSNVILQNESGEVLVLRRTKDHASRGLMPDLPGGTVEANESFKQTAIRETQEETGIILKPADLTLVYENTVQDPQRPVSGKIFMAVNQKKALNISLSWEHDQYYWIMPRGLRGFSDFHQKALNSIFQ